LATAVAANRHVTAIQALLAFMISSPFYNSWAAA
jgi:hypothetical protein